MPPLLSPKAAIVWDYERLSGFYSNRWSVIERDRVNRKTLISNYRNRKIRNAIFVLNHQTPLPGSRHRTAHVYTIKRGIESGRRFDRLPMFVADRGGGREHIDRTKDNVSVQLLTRKNVSTVIIRLWPTAWRELSTNSWPLSICSSDAYSPSITFGLAMTSVVNIDVIWLSALLVSICNVPARKPVGWWFIIVIVGSVFRDRLNRLEPLERHFIFWAENYIN